MGTTPRFGLRYAELTDAPNGPAQQQALASDVEGWLARAYPCTDATRPTGVSEGFLVDVTDLGTLEIRRAGAWAVIGAGSSGGGGSSGAVGTVSATYAGAAQSIPSNTDVVVAFATAQVTDPAVTRATSGAGHSFTLGQTRLWTISATLRFAQNASGGRTFELRAGSAVIAKTGADAPINTPYTGNLSVTRKLAAGTVITAIARHNAGTSLSLDVTGGDYVHIDLAGV